jgi:glycosyltransferase involved in cell wall biosynthesis
MIKPAGKRVLMLLENCSYPSDERVRHEAQTLTSNGYSVSVIAPVGKTQPMHECIDGVEVFRFVAPISAGGLMGYIWEYGYSMLAIFIVSIYVLIRKGFDIVHAAHPPDTFGLIGGFYKLLGKCYILDHHDLAPELYRFARFREGGNIFIYKTLLWFEKLAFRFADHVISTNTSYKEIAIARGGVHQNRITIVRNGPDMEELRCPEVDHALRASARTIIGYVGVTGTQDGVDNLLNALNCMVTELDQKDFRCVIVGTGSAMPGLKLLTKELNLEPYILFTGWVSGQDSVARYLNSCDICVAPEPSDPYNDRSTAAKVMEYMAMGKPVVSFDLPEHRRTAGESALYAKPGDPLDFGKKIVALINDPAQRDILGQTGKERIKTEFSWPNQARKLLEGYGSLFNDA